MGLPEEMRMSISGQSRVPPGFRFHLTEEELLQYYQKKRVLSYPINLDLLPHIDLNKLEPWDIQQKCKIGSTKQNEWYFYSHGDKKYPTSTRTNWATTAGFWKATGRDKVIYAYSERIRMRKTLVFYKGRAPHGEKSEWMMHEYRLINGKVDSKVSRCNGEVSHEEGWVVCRVYKKTCHHKIGVAKSPLTRKKKNNNINNNDDDEEGCDDDDDDDDDNNNNNNNKKYKDRGNMVNVEDNNIYGWPTSSSEEGTLEQIIHDIRKTKKESDGPIQVQWGESFKGTSIKLPSLVETPKSISNSVYEPDISNDWATFDRLLDSQLNGQSELTSQAHLPCFGDPTIGDFHCHFHLWG